MRKQNLLTPTPLGELTTSVKRGLSSSYLKDGEVSVRLLKAKDFDEDGRVDIDNVVIHPVKKTAALDKAYVKEGDILVSLKGKSFKTAIFPKVDGNFVISGDLIVISLKDQIAPEIVALYLRSEAGKQELQKRAAGSAILSLNTKQLLEVRIPVPSPDEQKEILRSLKEIEELREIIKKEGELIEKISDRLLDFFTGGVSDE